MASFPCEMTTLSATCKGYTQSGTSCTKKTQDPSGFCHLHGGWTAQPHGGAGGPVATPAHDPFASGALFGMGTDPDAPALPPTAPLPVGFAPGIPVLVGGSDLYDSSATLASYLSEKDPDSSYEVLHTRVTPEGEAKLIEALGLDQVKLVPVVKDVPHSGTVPLDATHSLHSQIQTLAVSVNARMKKGSVQCSGTSLDGSTCQNPASTEDDLCWRCKNKDRFAALEASLDAAETAAVTDADKDMVAAYRAQAAVIEERFADGYTVPYTAGGKIDPPLEQFETTWVTQENGTEEVVVADADVALLPTKERNSTRIDPSIDEKGVASWDGKRTSKSPGREWSIQLGDGYTAVYRPRVLADLKGGDHVSGMGRLTIVAPAGAGRGDELVNRLGRLHLANKPLTKEQAEYAFLERNIEAMGLTEHPLIADARAKGQVIDDTYAEQVTSERMTDFFDEQMTIEEFALLTKEIRAEAETRALPDRVKVTRSALAAAAGWGSGDDLSDDASYDPTPVPSAGWVKFRRIDMAPGAPAAQAWSGLRIVHKVGSKSGGSLADMIRNGGTLASQERRRTYGTPKGLGMSEPQDAVSMGGSSVFFNGVKAAGKVSSHGTATLHWDGAQLSGLLGQTGWYASNGDKYGALNPHDSHYNAAGISRDPIKAAQWASASSAEIMIEEGVDFLRTNPPTRIVVPNAGQRQAILSALTAAGFATLGGRPAADVVTVG